MPHSKSVIPAGHCEISFERVGRAGKRGKKWKKLKEPVPLKVERIEKGATRVFAPDRAIYEIVLRNIADGNIAVVIRFLSDKLKQGTFVVGKGETFRLKTLVNDGPRFVVRAEGSAEAKAQGLVPGAPRNGSVYFQIFLEDEQVTKQATEQLRQMEREKEDKEEERLARERSIQEELERSERERRAEREAQEAESRRRMGASEEKRNMLAQRDVDGSDEKSEPLAPLHGAARNLGSASLDGEAQNLGGGGELEGKSAVHIPVYATNLSRTVPFPGPVFSAAIDSAGGVNLRGVARNLGSVAVPVADKRAALTFEGSSDQQFTSVLFGKNLGSEVYQTVSFVLLAKKRKTPHAA